jgi:8-oxo-dGTP diphosphatase
MVGKKLGAAAVILDTQGRVLLVRHTYGPLNWELPGGGAERGENIVDTAVREVLEETGLHVVAQHTTGIYYDRQADMLHFVFLCQPRDTTLAPRSDGEEISERGFWLPTALPRPLSDFTVRRIVDAISGAKQPLAAAADAAASHRRR